MGGKRFDIQVPEGSTILLEQLVRESSKTGISEARLLVQFAARYAEMVAHGEATMGIAIPLLSLPTSPVQASVPGAAPAGQSALGVQEAGMQPLLNDSVLGAYLEDD